LLPYTSFSLSCRCHRQGQPRARNRCSDTSSRDSSRGGI